MPRELKDYTDEELYSRLEYLRLAKARLPRSHNQYTQHTRNYYKAEQARVRAELRRRGLPVRKPTDRRVLPTAAHIAVEKAAA
jgi:hypothetical protein